MTVERVLLAEPRGFCAGVEMAIKALTWMTRIFDGPVYCYHEIVHNEWVVKAFERVGVVFVNDIAEVPEGAPIMLSAHGSAPEVVAAAAGPCRSRDRRGVPPGHQGASRGEDDVTARATTSSTSATRDTTRQWAPWPRPRTR